MFVIVSFLFDFSNGMEVDGFHIRVDLTGQNKKVEKQSNNYYSKVTAYLQGCPCGSEVACTV